MPLSNTKMNTIGESSSSTTSTVEKEGEDEPPDSGANLSFKANPPSRDMEPLQNLGSFFVGSLKTEIVSDLQRCRFLWQELSLNKTLFDTWEFRFAFYLGYKYEPYFILLKNEKENLALLPLWYDKDEKKYVWFGSSWQEETRFFAKDPGLIPILISLAPAPLYLNAISCESADSVKNSISFLEDSAKYILNVRGFSSHEDYLATLRKNDRRGLKKDKKRLEEQGAQIIVDNFSDFDALVDLAKKRFKLKGEEADWEDPRRIETFSQVIKLSGASYKARMITIKVGEKIAGVDLVCLFKDTYFTVKCGYNVAEFPGVGNYMNLMEIDDAIGLGMKKIDFLQNNYTWKSRWFEAVPLVYYQK